MGTQDKTMKRGSQVSKLIVYRSIRGNQILTDEVSAGPKEKNTPFQKAGERVETQATLGGRSV